MKQPIGLSGPGKHFRVSLAVAVFSVLALPSFGEETPPCVRFVLDTAEGKPCDLVVLHLEVSTSVPLSAVSFALDFDETTLEIESVGPPQEAGAAFPLADTSAMNLDNRDEVAGNQVEEGWLYLELDASNSQEVLDMPLDRLVPVFDLCFRIREAAPAGFTAVKFANIGPVRLMDQTVMLANSADGRDAPGSPEMFLPQEMIDGGVEVNSIIGEFGFFLRADTDMNLTLELTDPVRTLTYLFQGGAEVPCEDAADADDDGELSLSDAIYTLERLFVQSRPFPPPNTFGPDPTEDSLHCAATDGDLTAEPGP